MSRENDAFVESVDELEHALGEITAMTERMRGRISEIREALDAGRSLKEVVPSEARPLLVQLLTEAVTLLQRCGNRVRRTEARVLYSEGMTMEEIASQFGVTRQRVSALLRDRTQNPA